MQTHREEYNGTDEWKHTSYQQTQCSHVECFQWEMCFSNVWIGTVKMLFFYSPWRVGHSNSYESVSQVVTITMVAWRAEVNVRTFIALPANAIEW